MSLPGTPRDDRACRDRAGAGAVDARQFRTGRALIAAVRRAYARNDGAMRIAIACGGTGADKEALLLQRLATPDLRGGVLVAQIGHGLPPPSRRCANGGRRGAERAALPRARQAGRRWRMTDLSAPLRLRLDGGALVANWRTLAAMSGSAACGAAVKADGYGLGARAVIARLAAAGCRDFFVATWGEAARVADLIAANELSLSVLHGVRAEDMDAALASPARPVLNTSAQVVRWRAGGGVRPCDVMVDTGMHRLGVSVEDIGAGLLDGLAIETLMSHLACADEPSPMNEQQRTAFAALAGRTGARRMSLANSAGVALGGDYALDLTRPGIALYGGAPCAGLAGRIRQVVTPQTQILQRRLVPAGGCVGYNATWTAARDTPVGIVNLGYADGYLRGFSGRGCARAGEAALPVIGRVSMDLVAIDLTAAPALDEGDRVTIDYALAAAAAVSGLSQYELLTGLGGRFDRVWA